MSHYGIVKRQRYWLKPNWNSVKHIHQPNLNFFVVNGEMRRPKILKYESDNSSYFGIDYNNVIYEILDKGLLITYWEGTINQEPLNNSETLVINDEKFTVSNVEKNINGTVTYYVDDLIVESVNYGELLVDCEKKYEQCSKRSIPKSEDIVEKEYSPYDELFNEMREQSILEESKKPWWKRIFS